MLKVYGFEVSPPANKVRMCANLLGLDYEYVNVDLSKGEQNKEAYHQVNPLGKVPAIDDNGYHLSESNAILKYLCRKNHSELYPQDLDNQATIDQWCDFTSMHLGEGIARVLFNQIFAPIMQLEVDERSIKHGQESIARYLPIIEQQLSKNAYLAGEQMSIADICLLATLDPIELIKVDLTPYPHLKDWRDKLRNEQFYQRVHHYYGENFFKNPQ